MFVVVGCREWRIRASGVLWFPGILGAWGTLAAGLAFWGGFHGGGCVGGWWSYTLIWLFALGVWCFASGGCVYL